jgi:hypothetical protein
MKYPGTIPDPATQLWFAQAAAKAGFQELVTGQGKTNPCVRLYGDGPAEAKCKQCRLFVRKHFSKTYFKCELRGNTNGPATDHRANWPACGRFVKREMTTEKLSAEK